MPLLHALLLLAPSAAAAGTVDLPGEAQLELAAAGVIRRLQPVWSVDDEPELAWLLALQNDPTMIAELAALALADESSQIIAPPPLNVDPGMFSANYDPSHIARAGADEWSALPLMNKGILLPNGCAAAPKTCAALGRLQPFLTPKPPAATEVGVRLLKLQVRPFTPWRADRQTTPRDITLFI